MDPQCIIQYVHWYHEPETGEKRLIKTGRNSSEPYSHVIEEVLEAKKQEILTLEERKQSLWEQKEDLEERNSKLKELKNNFEKIRESLETERINLDEKLREKQSAFSSKHSSEVIKV